MSKKSQNKRQSDNSKQIKKAVAATTTDSKSRNRTVIVLIFIVSFLFYGNTMQNEFAMDDELVTLNHSIVSKGIRGIPQIFTSRYVQNQKQSYEYRPVVLTSFAIEHQFTDGNASFSHFINIILYALTGVVLFFLLSRLFIQYHWILPAAVTFLFLIHPIHSEVVASLKNRDELLSFLFTLLTIRAFLNYFDTDKIKYIGYGLLLFFAAILSKKSALPLVFTLPVILYFFKGINLKKAAIFLITPILILLAYRFFMHQVFEQAVREGLYFENPLYVDKPGLIGKLPMAFYSMAYYVKLLIIPYPLLVYYGYDQVEVATWSNWIAVLSMLVFVSAGIYSIIKLKEKNIFVFGFLYFVLNIGPFSNIIPMPGIIAERFVYGASLGFSIMVCYGIFYLMKMPITKDSRVSLKNNAVYAFVGISFISCVYTFQRNTDWKNHLSIYTTDIVKAPNSAKIHALIGGFCMQTLEKNRTLTDPNARRLTQKEILDLVNLSKKHFNQAIEVYPEYAACQNNLGTLYYTYIGDIDSAFTYFKKTIELDPEHMQAHFNMGSYHEIAYGTESMIATYFENKMASDSVDQEIQNTESYKTYITKIKPVFRTSTIAYSDISKKLQEFINASRQKGTNNQNIFNFYVNELNNYWVQLLLKHKVDPSQSIAPGQNILNAIITTTTNDQNEFIAKIKNEINRNFILQFQPLINSEFSTLFNRLPDSVDFLNCHKIIRQQKTETRKNMIDQYYLALFQRDEVYPPAYTRLIQIYTFENMWDSLINMNLRLLNTGKAVRKGDAYRIIATSYQNLKNFDKALEYFELSVKDEEEILQRIKTSLTHQNKAGNNTAVVKLSSVLLNIKNTIATIYSSLAVISQEMNDPEKSEFYQKRSMTYRQ